MPGPILFPVAEDFRLQSLTLPSGLHLTYAPAEEVRLRYFDSAEGALMAQQSILEGQGDSIHWISLNGQGSLGRLPACEATVYDPKAWAAGRLRKALRSQPPVKRFQMASHRQTAIVSDHESKTIARLRLDCARVKAPGRSKRDLPLCLVMEPVRGYDRAVQGLVDHLAQQINAVPDPRPLVALALEALAQPDQPLDPLAPAHEVAAHVLEPMTTKALKRAKILAVAPDDPKAVRQYRIALRRLRSLLRLCTPMLGTMPATETGLKTLGQIAAPARDGDILLACLQDWSDQGATGLDPLIASVRADRTALAENLPQLCGPERLSAVLTPLRTRLGTAPSPMAPPPLAYRQARYAASLVLWRRYKKLCRQARQIHKHSPADALHDIRKRVKKLRYGMETFDPLWPDGALLALIPSLQAMQDVLGAHQDADARAQLLSYAAKGLSDPPDITAILTDLAQDQALHRRRFKAVWQQFDSKSVRRGWAATLEVKRDEI